MESPPAKRKAKSRAQSEFDAIAHSEIFGRFFQFVDSLTGLKPALIDHRGTMILPCPRSKLNKFCQLIHRTAAGWSACERSDAANLPRPGGGPRVYQCHAGLTDISMPIVVSGEHVATIVCGQVLTRTPSDRGFRAVLRKIGNLPVDATKLRQAYFATRVVPYHQLRAMSQMIAFFAGYLSEIGSRIALLERQEEKRCIRIAREFMIQNFHAPLTLNEVASVAALSPKYFSRLFAQQVGESYVRHLNRIRVEKAKEQLLHRESRVTDVALRSGFESIPNFNRVFRSFEKMSPTDFRKRAGGSRGRSPR
jgi:AraC-like DNA-binding protein/ligand-binding sensor protein